MTTVSTENLNGIISNALERMAFVFTEESAMTSGEVLAKAIAHAAVDVRGTTCFLVTVSATAGMVKEVASGMMGCDAADIDPDDHGGAVVSELANVLGGELIVRMQAKDESLCMGLPRELIDDEVGRACDQATSDGVVCAVDGEDGTLLVTFSPV